MREAEVRDLHMGEGGVALKFPVDCDFGCSCAARETVLRVLILL